MIDGKLKTIKMEENNGQNNNGENQNGEQNGNQNGNQNGSQNSNTPAVNQGQEVAHNQPMMATNEFGEEIKKLIVKAGTLDTSKDELAILHAPIEPRDIYIKPDGLVYLTWIKYQQRLCKAYGTSWTMIPQGMPKIYKNNIVWGFHLIVRGVYCGFAIGEQDFHDNGRMTYGEGCEGAKSNALTRLCKAFGIGSELWDKGYTTEWQNKYAQKKWNEQKKRYDWSLKPGAFDTPQTEQKTEQKQTTITNPNPSVNPIAEHVSTTPKATQTTGQGQNNQGQDQNTTVVTVKTDTNGKNGNGNGNGKKNDGKNEGKGGAGKGAGVGKGKLPENQDFLKDKKEEVPVVPITDEEATRLAPDATTATGTEEKSEEHRQKKFVELKDLIEKSDTTGKLKMNYETLKKAQANGDVSEEQKEVLRKIANQLFVKLASEGK
jgi:hypothetical protein